MDRAQVNELEKLARHLYMMLDQKLAPLLKSGMNMDIAAREVRLFMDESPMLVAHLDEGQRGYLVYRVASELAGYGPIQRLMDDPEVTDIMVNRYDRVYVMRAGRMEEARDVRFWDEGHLLRIVQRIAVRAGRKVDPGNPVLDARMPDGSRAHAVLQPVAVEGTALTIRKFLRRFFSAEELVRVGTISEEMAEFLRVMVEDRANIVIAGAPGTGKTTLLNVLGSFIPPGERVVTIEDVAELQLPVRNCVRLEASPGSSETAEVTIRDLLRAALRMRPDRIIVGEVRGAEALEMLQAMHAGHRGSYSTLHASSCRNALSRLEAMVLQAGTEYTLRAIRELIAQSVHLVVWMQQTPDGRRVVGELSEVVGMENDTVSMQQIWKYNHAYRRHEWTGIVPVIWSRLREEYELPPLFERMHAGRVRGW